MAKANKEGAKNGLSSMIGAPSQDAGDGIAEPLGVSGAFRPRASRNGAVVFACVEADSRPIRKNAVRQNGVIHNGWATRIRTRTKGTKNPCAAITPWPSKKKAGEPRLWKNRWWAVRESNPRPWD